LKKGKKKKKRCRVPSCRSKGEKKEMREDLSPPSHGEEQGEKKSFYQRRESAGENRKKRTTRLPALKRKKEGGKKTNQRKTPALLSGKQKNPDTSEKGKKSPFEPYTDQGEKKR